MRLGGRPVARCDDQAYFCCSYLLLWTMYDNPTPTLTHSALLGRLPSITAELVICSRV